MYCTKTDQARGRTMMDLVHQVREASSVDELERGTTAWAQDQGFERWVYGVGSATITGMYGTYPDEWMREYRSSNAHGNDPIIHAVDSRRRAFKWDLRDRESGLFGPSLTVHQGSMLDDRWDMGVRSGITVPVYTGLHQTRGILSLTNELPVDARVRFEQETIVVLFGHFLQQRLIDLVGHEKLDTAGILLSDREREVLHWTAIGKTNAEIARILGIKPDTAKYHLENAGKKLGCTNRTAATAKALQYGLITL